MFDNQYMDLALELAETAYQKGEVPVGAVIVDSETLQIIATAHNLTQELNSPIEHAELIALRHASQVLGAKHLSKCDLYVTLEPCPLCAAAISSYRVGRLFYGAPDLKQGAVESASSFFGQKNCFFKPEIYSCIKAEESSTLMKNFFRNIRNNNNSELT